MQVGAWMSALGDGCVLLSGLVLKEGSCRQSWETNGDIDGRVQVGREGSSAHSPSSTGALPPARPQPGPASLEGNGAEQQCLGLRY